MRPLSADGVWSNISPVIRATVGLMHRILTMPFPWNAWVGLLGVVNVVGGFWFWPTPQGKVALAAIGSAFVVMVAIYARHGFVRLLGLGHILFWVPLLIYFGLSLSTTDLDGPFRLWLWSIVLLNGISLLIDMADVARYLRGEREPI